MTLRGIKCYCYWSSFKHFSTRLIRSSAHRTDYRESSFVDSSTGEDSRAADNESGLDRTMTSAETVHEVSFGTVRHDFDNRPTVHGGQFSRRRPPALLGAARVPMSRPASARNENRMRIKFRQSASSPINSGEESFHQLITMKLKNKEESLDSKGFRILRNQVLDLKDFTKEEIIKVLKSSILYLDDDLVVLNKVYNFIIHESLSAKYPCLSQYLDCFARTIEPNSNNSKLFTIHRLDRETTGCLLLARNENAAYRFKSLFSQRNIIKKYWMLTSGVPVPSKGVIDIPISEGTVQNKKRMVLHPDLPAEVTFKNHSVAGKPAVTSYHVKSMSGNAAFVEAIPVTGIKHQIRVHFGFGMACPILGDHKYSHLDKMVPQTLPSDILQKLHVRQAKVRHIPMHLHAYSITIPEYRDGKDLSISAPLPFHMTATMKRLKLKNV